MLPWKRPCRQRTGTRDARAWGGLSDMSPAPALRHKPITGQFLCSKVQRIFPETLALDRRLVFHTDRLRGGQWSSSATVRFQSRNGTPNDTFHPTEQGLPPPPGNPAGQQDSTVREQDIQDSRTAPPHLSHWGCTFNRTPSTEYAAISPDIMTHMKTN
jgi:hypothetical protein